MAINGGVGSLAASLTRGPTQVSKSVITAMKHSFFRIPVLFINFADNRNGSHVSLFTLLMEREFFNHPNRFIQQCDGKRGKGSSIFCLALALAPEEQSEQWSNKPTS